MAYRSSMLVFVLFLALPCAVSAQAGDDAVEVSTVDILDNDLDIFLQDGADIFTAPGRWDGRDWLTAGAVIGATAVAYAFDENVRAEAQRIRTEESDDWLYVGNLYGRPETPLIVGGGLFLGGLVADDDATRVTGRMVLESFVYAGLLNIALKSLFGRARPYRNEGKSKLYWFQSDNDFLSFPSGHSTMAFALSSTLAARIDNIYASIALYAMALVTVTQRIMTDNHWLSDTVMGAATGTAVGLAVVKYGESHGVELDAGEAPYMGGLSPHVPFIGIKVGM